MSFITISVSGLHSPVKRMDQTRLKTKYRDSRWLNRREPLLELLREIQLKIQVTGRKERDVHHETKINLKQKTCR